MLEVLVNAALANLNSVFQHGKKNTFFMYFSCQMYLSLVSKLRFIYGHKLLSWLPANSKTCFSFQFPQCINANL